MQEVHRLTITLEPWQAAAIERRAQRDGVAVDEVVRSMVTRQLAEDGPGARYRRARVGPRW